MLVTLFDYNAWANERIRSQAKKLMEEQLKAPMIGRNLHDLLFHTMRTEWVWRYLAQQRRTPEEELHIEDFPTLAKIQERWQEEEVLAQNFVADISEQELVTPLEIPDRRGNVSTLIPWQMLMHLILHSQQHRAEAAELLTEYGASPGDLDFIYWVP
jgi:uncharacterized damage-inducible protein DinB